jgi:hypothetical protein
MKETLLELFRSISQSEYGSLIVALFVFFVGSLTVFGAALIEFLAISALVGSLAPTLNSPVGALLYFGLIIATIVGGAALLHKLGWIAP